MVFLVPGLNIPPGGKGDRRSERPHLVGRVAEAVKSGTLLFSHAVRVWALGLENTNDTSDVWCLPRG